MSDGKPSCFVAMPITTAPEALPLYGNDKDHFAHVLDYLFTPAIEQAGYRVITPKMLGADIIQATIIRHLEEADLVLCDISLHNPNVFFELGIRTALDRVVAVVKDDKTDKLPFDTSIINTYCYDSTLTPWTLQSQISAISEHIKVTAEQAKDGNALWQYFGLTKRAAVPASTDDPNAAKLDLMLEEIQQLRAEVDVTAPSRQPSVSDLEAASAASRQQFLPIAIASKRNPDGVSITEYPETFRNLLTGMVKIADEVNATFVVVKTFEDEIVIDFGPFLYSDRNLKAMKGLATAEAKSIIIQR
jgi:hypothetical protein